MATKQQIRKLVWNMACSVSNGVHLFNSSEYKQLCDLNFRVAQYKSIDYDGFLSDQTIEFQAMFVLFIYYSMS